MGAVHSFPLKFSTNSRAARGKDGSVSITFCFKLQSETLRALIYFIDLGRFTADHTSSMLEEISHKQLPKSHTLMDMRTDLTAVPHASLRNPNPEKTR